MDKNFVSFKTGMFRDEQPDGEIDLWFLGEDCSKWLYSGLLAIDGMTPALPPLEEDWGWVLGIRADGVRFSIGIWGVMAPVWIVGILPKDPLTTLFRKERIRSAKARLCDAIDSVLASLAQSQDRRWTEDFPVDFLG